MVLNRTHGSSNCQNCISWNFIGQNLLGQPLKHFDLKQATGFSMSTDA